MKQQKNLLEIKLNPHFDFKHKSVRIIIPDLPNGISGWLGERNPENINENYILFVDYAGCEKKFDITKNYSLINNENGFRPIVISGIENMLANWDQESNILHKGFKTEIKIALEKSRTFARKRKPNFTSLMRKETVIIHEY